MAREGEVDVSAHGSAEDAETSPAPQVKTSRSLLLDQNDWSKARKMAYNFSTSAFMENTMALLITFNVGIMVWEVNMRAGCRFAKGQENCTAPLWISMTNFALLLCYTVEIILHIFARRRAYFVNVWNYVEMVIVIVGFVDFALSFESDSRFPNLIFLRLFRLFKLLRTVRLMVFFPELYELLRGFAGAAYVMFWGAVLIIIMLGLWSIVAVESMPTPTEMWEDEFPGETEDPKSVHHPLPPDCHEVFHSVPNAMLWFFQTLVAGDSWGKCSIPIIFHTPMSLIVFLGALICIELGVTNLILAVIVDAAAGAREKDHEQKLRKKAKEERAGLEHWRTIVSEIDRDGSGTISLKELMTGFDGNPEVRQCFQLLDVDREDLQNFFFLLDHDSSGDLSYSEFFHDLQKAHTQDTRMYLMSLKLQISHITHLLHEQMGRAEPRGAGNRPPHSHSAPIGEDKAERGPPAHPPAGPPASHPAGHPAGHPACPPSTNLGSDAFLAKLQAQLDQLTEDASAHAEAILQNTQKLEAILISCNIEDPAPRRNQQTRVAPGPAKSLPLSQQFSSNSGQQSRTQGAARAPSENQQLGSSSSRVPGTVNDPSESQQSGPPTQGTTQTGKSPNPARIAM